MFFGSQVEFLLIITLLTSHQLQWKVFCYQIIVSEDDAQVEFKVDLKVPCLQRWTSEQSGECHVDRDLNLGANVAVGDL